MARWSRGRAGLPTEPEPVTQAQLPNEPVRRGGQPTGVQSSQVAATNPHTSQAGQRLASNAVTGTATMRLLLGATWGSGPPNFALSVARIHPCRAAAPPHFWTRSQKQIDPVYFHAGQHHKPHRPRKARTQPAEPRQTQCAERSLRRRTAPKSSPQGILGTLQALLRDHCYSPFEPISVPPLLNSRPGI